jgi:hypothetical protein
MARFVRYIVHQRIEGEPRQSGLFTAAYYLRDNGELLQSEWDRLQQLLAWFTAELTVPPRGTIPEGAIFWYVDVGPFSERMWELVQILSEHGFTAELITARSIGKVVYQDKHQLAAIPRRRRKGT